MATLDRIAQDLPDGTRVFTYEIDIHNAAQQVVDLAIRLNAEDAVELSQRYIDAEILPRVAVRLVKRRNRWALTVPLGSFTDNLQATPEMERAALVQLLEPVQQAPAGLRTHVPWVYRNPETEELFFRPELLKGLAATYRRLPLLSVVASFALDLGKDPSDPQGKKESELVRKIRRANRPKAIDPFIPFDQRPKRSDGRLTRGPAWSLAEDQILHADLGARDAGGTRPVLTDADWERLIAKLGHRRSRRSILARVSVLNKKLAQKIALDVAKGGFPLETARVYYREQHLGTRTRLPNLWRGPQRRRGKKEAMPT